MSSDKYIKDELNELNSQLPGNNGQENPFKVPEGYFEGFAASVMAKINENEGFNSPAEEIAALSPLLAGISRTMPFAIPEGYFSGNIDTLPAMISENEDSLVLSFIEKEMPYEVPGGYFASFPDTVLEKLNSQKRVIRMRPRKWMHVAAAAVVTGVILLSGLAYFRSATPTKDPVAVVIKKASTEDLNTFIKTTDISLTDEKTTAQNTSEVKQLLKDVSDKELENFLEQVPTDEEEDFDIN